MKITECFERGTIHSIVLYPYRGKTLAHVAAFCPSTTSIGAEVYHSNIGMYTYVLVLSNFTYHYPFYIPLPKESYDSIKIEFWEDKISLKINKDITRNIKH